MQKEINDKITAEEICNFYKTEVYKMHPNYKIVSTVIEGSSNFYMTVKLETGYCYCFLIIPDVSDNSFSEIKPSDTELKTFMEASLTPMCVLKRIIIIKKTLDGNLERRNFDPLHFEEI